MMQCLCVQSGEGKSFKLSNMSATEVKSDLQLILSGGCALFGAICSRFIALISSKKGS